MTTNIRLCKIPFLISSLFSSPVFSDVDLFIMAGQSNMQGYAGNAKYYPCTSNLDDLSIDFYYVTPDTIDHKLKREAEHFTQSVKLPPRFYTSLTHTWSKLRRAVSIALECPPPPQPSRQWTFLGPQFKLFPNGHFGPEISFARKLLTSGLKPVIFKYAKEGTSLAENWLAPGQNGLYDDFVFQLNSSISELQANGEKVNIRCLIWIQGESDGTRSDYANLYLPRLQELIRHLRQYVIGRNTPIILGVDETYLDLKRQPQIESAQIRISTQEPCVSRSSMRGLTKADATHLTPEALVEHGNRLFETYKQLTKTCPGL